MTNLKGMKEFGSYFFSLPFPFPWSRRAVRMSSQNHRQRVRLGETSGDHLVQLLNQSAREYTTKDSVQMAFKCSQGRRLHKFLNLQHLLSHSHSKDIYSHFQSDSLCFSLFGPIAGHHWKASGPILLTLSLQIIKHIDQITLSLIFSRLNRLSFLHLPHMSDASVP